MFEQLTLDDSVLRVLASSVLAPGLRTILLIDASYAQLNRAAQILQQMLESAAGATVERMDLSPTDTDDTLWGIPFFPGPELRARFVWRGKLTGGREDAYHLLVIPDLAQMSLAGERGCVMAAGAEVVHLERHAQHAYWQPKNLWLAACAEQDIGKVSLHLLDRFAVRINLRGDAEMSIEARAKALLHPEESAPDRREPPAASETLMMQLRETNTIQPVFSHEAAERVLTYFSGPSLYGVRRSLAVGRLATTEAMLDQASSVTPAHVDRAAMLVGLRPLSLPPSAAQVQEERQEATQPEPPSPALTSEPDRPPISTASAEAVIEPQPVPLYTPDATAALPEQPLQLGGTNPYPEDHLASEREAFALRWPVTQRGSGARSRGPSVGVEKARDMSDLALASTVFEAAKFWVVRRPSFSNGRARLEIWPGDLRQHRRLPAPESLLVLVMDYTSLRKCAWEDALLPHLEWAYTSRAAVALIRVGAKDAEHELRAESIVGRSLLAPQIAAALESEPGMATPLAHGLDLAQQVLLRSIQHGRSAVVKARLVILSDGRGNVPLAASRAGEIILPVRREGVEDALRAAAGLRMLHHVEIVFLDPQPSQYAELPEEFASIMGAQSVKLARRPFEDSTDLAANAEAAP